MSWRHDVRRGWNDRTPEEHERSLSDFASMGWRLLFVIVWVLVLGAALDWAGVL